MKNDFGRHSIQFKLTVTFLIILLPLAAAGVVANLISHRMLYEEISERTSGGMLTTLDYIEELTKNMDQQTLLIGSNPNLVEVWRGVSNPLHRERLYDVHTVQKQLTALTNVNGAVKEAFIVHGISGSGVSTSRGAIRWPEIREEAWFQRTLDARGGLYTHIPADGDPEASKYLTGGFIYFARLLDVFGNTREPNVLVLAVDTASLRKIVQHLQSSPNTEITLFYNGDVVLNVNPMEGDGGRRVSLRAENDFWSIVLEQPHAELFEQPRKLQQYTYFIIAISVVLAVWTAWIVYSGISRPLYRLSGALRKFSGGDLKVNISHRRKDEIGALMDAFNQMAEAQRKLIEQDYEKELRLARSEFALLQSQINPHFLYNTLDSIYSAAVTDQMPEVSEMVYNLAHFFRVSLGKGKDAFTLEETLQHLMYYIRVQQIRMDHFTVQMDIAEETRSIPIVKLLLQPIVENAIVHGLAPSAGGGALIIRSRLEPDLLKIVIEDTGIGIEAPLLADIRAELNGITAFSYRSNDIPFQRHFGLKNVKSRMKLYYGERADLQIESVFGEGTRVTLTLPTGKEEPA